MEANKHSANIKTIRTVSYVGYAIWVPVLFSTLLIFAGNGPASLITRWLAVIFIWTVPIASFLGARLANKALEKNHIKTAYCLIGFPTIILLSPLLFSILMIMKSFTG